ncbi:MAG: 50S ribosomal protein L5 [Chlorobi bacterium]|jgi:large subunit ribosomal protein L5|nr:50S ribosomal protein L5 [Chlorobiota bacterium]
MAKEKKQKQESHGGGSRPDVVATVEAVAPRLIQKYREQVVPAMMKQFGYANIMQVPRLVKITLNRGVGDATGDQKLLQTAVDELQLISGQRPAVTKAKNSISNFKLREGVAIGARVTLRGARMYEFFDRFVAVAAPRIRDFRGFPDRSFDGRGNYSMGVKEQIIFPEIDVDKVVRIDGMDISFVTTANTDEEAYALLKEMGFPFRKREGAEA